MQTQNLSQKNTTIFFNIATLTVFFICILILFSSEALSYQGEKESLKMADRAVGRHIGEHTLIDQGGNNFSLKEFIGKPLVISFIYTSCGHICPTITMNLKNAVREAGKDFGVKFNAITIGFDVENDTPQRMRQYGSNFTNDFKNWRFATANKEAIDRLANDIGFYYRKVDGGFDHLNLVTVVDEDGKIYKQIYGMDFKPHEVLQPIYQSLSAQKGAPFAQSSGILSNVLLFCYKYNEATGKYEVDYPMVVTLLMGPLFLSIMIFLIIYIFRSSERKELRHPQNRL